MTINVLVCEDQTFVRAGVHAHLVSESDIKVVEDPNVGRTALGCIFRQLPDVVLTGTLSAAVEIAKGVRGRITHSSRPPGIIALVTNDEERSVVEALLAGVRGVVRHDAPPADLVGAVRAVAAGEVFLPPRSARSLLDWAMQATPPPGDPPAEIAALTRSESRVLHLIATGMTGREVAEYLDVSYATIRSHIHHMVGKLGVRNRSEAIAYAYRHRLVRPQ